MTVKVQKIINGLSKYNNPYLIKAIHLHVIVTNGRV